VHPQQVFPLPLIPVVVRSIILTGKAGNNV